MSDVAINQLTNQTSVLKVAPGTGRFTLKTPWTNAPANGDRFTDR